MPDPDALHPTPQSAGKAAPAGRRPTTAAKRKAAAERQARHRERKRQARDGALTGQLETLQGAVAGDLHPADAETQGNDAAAAVTAGKTKAKRGGRSKREPADTPITRAQGWLRLGQTIGVGLSTGQLRDLARRVMEVDFLPYCQELIADPDAKDTDKLRAGDIVARLSMGYMTPDVMNAEDAPELPPPIFETTDGVLPGEDAPVYDDAEPVEVPAAEGASA